jgi:hypothetical protein
VRPAPDITPAAEWLDAWDGHELRELSRERTPAAIRNRKSIIMIMARHFTADGVTDPCLSWPPAVLGSTHEPSCHRGVDRGRRWRPYCGRYGGCAVFQSPCH